VPELRGAQHLHSGTEALDPGQHLVGHPVLEGGGLEAGEEAPVGKRRLEVEPG
jgi:hypothetical protein